MRRQWGRSERLLAGLTAVPLCCRAAEADRPAGAQWEDSARDSRVGPWPAQLPQCPALPVHQPAADQCQATRYGGCWAAPPQQLLLLSCSFPLLHGDFGYFFS